MTDAVKSVKPLTDDEVLAEIKKRFGYNTTHLDDVLKGYIADVIGYMISAGVSETVARSTASVGCIFQGVNDLWNYSGGSVKFSPYFEQRLIQLRD